MMLDLPTFPRSPLTKQSSQLLAVAFLIGLAAYWFRFINIIGSCSVGSYANAARALVLLLLGFTGGVLQSKRISIFGGMGVLCGWCADLLLSTYQPTIFHCSHQLLPFEATPFCAPDCVNVSYCVTCTGKIEALMRSNRKGCGRNCWNEGAAIQQLFNQYNSN